MAAILPPTIRLPGEGDTAFAAFGRYLLSGWLVPETMALPRRVPRVARAVLNAEFGAANVALWSRNFDWAQRATAYDSEVLCQNRKIVEELRAMTSANLAAVTSDASQMLLVELQRTIDRMVATGETVPLKDLTRMLSEVAKTNALLTPGAGAGNGAAPQKDFSNLSTEELTRLAMETE